jgi:hypothetical protein
MPGDNIPPYTTPSAQLKEKYISKRKQWEVATLHALIHVATITR